MYVPFSGPEMSRAPRRRQGPERGLTVRNTPSSAPVVSGAVVRHWGVVKG